MALTAIPATTKAGSQKTIRQRALSVKEDTADPAVACPPDALKSVELSIEGVNDEGAFGTNTIGQKITGKILLYASDSNIRNFAHELVTKDIKYAQLVTNSGLTYTFQSADTTPAIVIAYGKADLVAPDDKPSLIELIVSGYRDNLVMS